MQLAAPQQTQFTAVMRPSPPLRDVNPRLDGLVGQQARFRITGTGPLTQRGIEPVSDGARQLLAEGPAATDAVRGVLALVEHVAGGPRASASLQLNGVALADSPVGHGANTYRAHMDDDHVLKQSLARFRGSDRAGQVARLGEQTLQAMSSTRANVTAGWVNVGPTASLAMLGKGGAATQSALAESVRTLLHESAHVADQSAPRLSTNGAVGLREALAEARSTTLPQLQAARSVLGLDGRVTDVALQGSLAIRPYRRLEQLLSGGLRLAGIDPASAEAARLMASPSATVADTLVEHLARRDGASIDAARTVFDETFAQVLAARG